MLSSQQNVVFLRNPEEIYFDLIEKDGPTVLLLGEREEQWTAMTLSYLEKSGLAVTSLSWSHLPEIRLSMELVHYPVAQCWTQGKLQKEVIGYQVEELRSFVDTYFHAKRTGDNNGKETQGAGNV